MHLLGELPGAIAPLADWVSTLPAAVESPPPTPGVSTALGASAEIPWWEKFFTGPPMAGLFAVVAAGVAYRGILRQVAKTEEANRLSRESNEHTKAANTETARKNSEDQWWTTLKWAYGEAKSLRSSTSSTENLALVRILQNLGELEGISEFQRSSANSVIGIFVASQDPRVRKSAARASKNVMATMSHSEARDSYVKALNNILIALAPSLGAKLHGSGYLPDLGMDWVVETTSGDLIAVEWRFVTRTARPSRGTEFPLPVGLDWSADGEPQRPVLKKLLITNKSGTEHVEFVVDALQLTSIFWDEGLPPDSIESALRELVGERLDSSRGRT